MNSTTTAPVIVIFGITGDLSRRKLLPALYHMIAHGVLDSSTRIIGTSRRETSKQSLLENVELCILEADKICDPIGLKKLHDALSIVKLDPEDNNDYKALSAVLDEHDKNGDRQRMLYMALPPNAYSPVIERLGAYELNDANTRLLIEKPFGKDMASAKALTKTMSQHFTEEQIYRIDHYLAKETAQNLMTFRLNNPIFSSLWNSQYIEKVHIRATEKIGIENRSAFYEETGALRDIIQSHLVQLLAIVMMDEPTDDKSEHIHEAKEAFLKSLQPAEVRTAYRAQYEGYRGEVQNNESTTETYARVELSSNATNWTGTRIILETGKALEEKITEVIVQFRYSRLQARNELRFRIQPDEGISLDLVVKKPGYDAQMQRAQLDFSYGTTFENVQSPDAYERVIMDAVRGDQSLFTNSSELLQAWRIVEPIVREWSQSDALIETYERGHTIISRLSKSDFEHRR